MTLSVIVPTIGRETLARAVDSASGADEVVVVVDEAKYNGQVSLPLPARVLRVRGGDRGYTARTVGMAAATGTHLAFLDDDDVYTPGAIDAMREAIEVNPERPIIFRMVDPLHGVLWHDPVLRFANVGTPMIVVPNDPEKLGEWAPHEAERGGDFTFVKGCVEKMGEPVWRSEIVARVRPGRMVTVVTPWFGAEELFPNYALAVEGADQILIVDNGSEPPLEFAAIRCEENAGFVEASNAGLMAASGEVVLFLNNDIIARRWDWFAKLTGAVEPGVLVGARLRYDKHGDVDGVSYPYLDGWCLAGMRDDLLALGGFWGGFQEPAYFCDNDLCFRARLAGMTLREIRIGLEHIQSYTTHATAMDEERNDLTAANQALFRARVRAMLAETTEQEEEEAA